MNFVAAVDEIVDADAYDATMRPGWRGARAAEARELEQGTLVITISDARDDELVWRGTATGAVEPGTEERERNRTLREAVDGVLERFPPRSK